MVTVAIEVAHTKCKFVVLSEFPVAMRKLKIFDPAAGAKLFRVFERLLSTFSISFTGLTSNAINMHFHGPADPGVSAGVLVPITGFPQAVSGNFSGTAFLTGTAEQESALLAGKMYLNIHSVNFPNGEVRAQIGVRRVD